LIDVPFSLKIYVDLSERHAEQKHWEKILQR